MKRRSFLGATGSAAVALALAKNAEAREPADKPNVIYMMLNEIGYFELSCMGHNFLTMTLHGGSTRI